MVRRRNLLLSGLWRIALIHAACG